MLGQRSLIGPIAAIRACLPVFYIAAIRASANLIPMTMDFGFEWLRQGNLFPFALNASPNGVSLPPPVALSWHCPQAFPVSVANRAVASAGREIIRQAVPAIKINAAVLKTRTRAFLAFTFIVVSELLMRLVQFPQTKPNPCQTQLTSKMGPRPKQRLCGIE
jgi:hypothetical protein